MIVEEEELFLRFRGREVLLDTNLLLLLLIGSYERKRIRTFKRTAMFSELDFDLLAVFLQAFTKILTTPHILTEVSNLTGSLPGHLLNTWNVHFSRNINGLVEVFEESRSLVSGGVFARFGLTDAAISSLSSRALTLTEDFRLSGFLRARNMPVLNFRELVSISSILRGRG
jgi:hypothetical protein